MIYAVNKRTKEHRPYEYGDENMDDEWRIVEAGPEGWIPWQGGECPLPEGAPFEARRRDGAIIDQKCVNFWGRNEKDDESDIIAYRPILDADTKPEGPAWDGDGLPPVGCECEVYEDAIWHYATIVAHHDGCAIVAIHRDDLSYEYGAYCGGAIRPLRSEEDEAVEAMMAATDEHLTPEDTCRALYRAGYRKEE